MIEANSLVDKHEGYLGAFKVALQIAEQDWHPAWLAYHEFYTRRHGNMPLQPFRDQLTSEDLGANTFGDDEQSLAVNHIQSIIRTIQASTFNRNPEFTVEPLYAGLDAPGRAKLAGLAVSNEWRKRNFTNVALEAQLDSLICGRGWVETGWHAVQTREVVGEKPGEVLKDALQAVADMSRRGANLGRKPFTGIEEIQQHMERFNGRLLVEEYPTLRRVSPFDMFFDPLALNPSDARWIARRWRCPVAWGRRNKDWSAAERKALDACTIDTTGFDPQDAGTNMGAGEYEGKDVTWIIDFFDLSEGTWSQFAPGGTGFLRKPEVIPLPYGQPFVWIENIEDTASSFPISEVEVIWPHQRDLSATAAEMANDRIRSRAKVAVPSDQFESMRPLLEASDDGLVVPVTVAPGQKITDNYHFFQPVSRSNELLQSAQVYANWMTQGSGVSDYMRGGAVGGTATEVNALQLAAANFMGEKSDKVRKFQEKIAERMLVLIQTYSRLDHFVTMMVPQQEQDEDGNPTGQPRMVEASVGFGRKDIMGSYRVIVSSDSAERATPQAKQSRAQAIAATAMPFVQMGIVDPGLLFKFVMKDGFGIDDPTSLLTQQAFMPQPQQQSQPGNGQAISGVSMTPGSGAGQLGASAAAERTAAGEALPSQNGGM